MSQPFTSGGYRWTAGVHYVGGMGLPDSAASRLFEYVTGNGIEWVKPSKIFSRIVIGDREYRIPAGAAQYANALKGYFPTEAKAIDDYIELVKNVSDSLAAFLATPLAKYPDRRAHEQIKFAYFDTFAGRRTIEVLSELSNDTELHAVLCGSWGDYGLRTRAITKFLCRARFGRCRIPRRRVLSRRRRPIVCEHDRSHSRAGRRSRPERG